MTGVQTCAFRSGIRGADNESVKKAWSIIKPLEPIEFTSVFETNQATDAHYLLKDIREVCVFDCLKLRGRVSGKPEWIQGGHVIFELSDDSGRIDCGVYKPTGYLRKAASKLLEGDVVEVFGGVGNHSNTVNVEKMRIVSLVEDMKERPPPCCGRNMTSAGSGKGYKCRTCSRKISHGKLEVVDRDLSEGWYEASAGARRHLCRPLVLDGLEVNTDS